MAGTPSPREREEIRIGWRMLGIGWQVTAEVLGGMLLGWLFDKWRGHGNTGVLVGAVVGIVVGLWGLVRGTMRLLRQLDEGRSGGGRQ